MMSCFFGSAVYFAQYNVGNAGKYAIISNCLSMAQIAFLFVTPFIMKKVSKKKGDGKGDDPFPDGAVRHQSVRRMRRHKNSDLP